MLGLGRIVAVVLLAASDASEASKQNISPFPGMVVECRGIAGANVSAPDWKARQDGADHQTVRLEYNGPAGGKLSRVLWAGADNKVYSEETGIGLEQRTGFAIVVWSDDRLETYVYNASGSEVLFSGTRSGHAVLPNIVKAFRGVCTIARS
jgi:hypothetical protein